MQMICLRLCALKVAFLMLMVDGLCKAHKVKDARNLLDAMSVEGCEPNHIVYDALIDGFCKARKLDDAQEVFAKMSVLMSILIAL